MAERLGLSATAEGIETDEQLATLCDLGCEFGQGYLFTRPVPADELPSFLEDAPWRSYWEDEPVAE
jgi:EAL domain-containing protein (putative c-di-GMP-specific phosphodiesterase class I)